MTADERHDFLRLSLPNRLHIEHGQTRPLCRGTRSDVLNTRLYTVERCPAVGNRGSGVLCVRSAPFACGDGCHCWATA